MSCSLMTIYSLYFVPANLTLDHTLSLYTRLHSVIKGLIYQAQEFEFVRWVYAPQLLSHHTKDLEWRTLKPPRHVTALGSWTDCVIALMSRVDRVIALRQISVTALLYLEDSRPVHLQGMRTCRFKDVKRRAPQRAGKRERESPLAPLFVCFFLPPGPVLCKLGSGRSSSIWSPHPVLGRSFDLPLLYFRRLFPSCLLATAILDSFSLF